MDIINIIKYVSCFVIILVLNNRGSGTEGVNVLDAGSFLLGGIIFILITPIYPL